MAELILNHPKVVPQKQKLLDYDDKSRRTALHIAAFKSKEGEMLTLTLTRTPNPYPTPNPYLNPNPDPNQVRWWR